MRKPIPKTLAELLKEEWVLMETLTSNLKIYSRGNERAFYDEKAQEILWTYVSELNYKTGHVN